MKPILLIFLFGLISITGISQNTPISPFKLVDEAKRNLNYLKPVKVLRDSAELYLNTDYEGYYYQALSTYQSYAGDYFGALKSYDKAFGRGKANKVDSTEDIKILPAAPLIYEKARKSQLLILNEAHHVALHRAFAASLLDSLYAMGYRYFAVETLLYTDDKLAERGYPIEGSGTYTIEPTFGNLIRKAAAVGFKFIAHEVRDDQEMEIEDWKKRSNFRDSIMAVNVNAVLEADENAKVFMYVGYDHLQEQEKDGIKRMAYFLKRNYGIDPFTIEQTEYTEKGSRKHESYMYEYVAGKIEAPSVVYTNGSLYKSKRYADLVDLQIFHSRTRFKSDRPDWLFKYLLMKPFSVYISDFKEQEIIVQAYYQQELNEEEHPVPLDHIAVTDHESTVSLALPAKPSGSLIIQIRDIENQVLREVGVD
ncbi:hypothetical protein LVD15_03050 [Fulvivirga maritima]|uniref:hypothetical protein n=1 Tax=Fulvivirga maritima TaxID=2904247 RepID=UPI001F1606F3|nr:hypothetical protein [Fulvivirga maritima]UII27423.1 hypothetical protein LVD15_03050 [Fulvivirga maritima]